MEPLQTTDNIRILGDNQNLGPEHYNQNGQSNEGLNENLEGTNFSDVHIKKHEAVGGRQVSKNQRRGVHASHVKIKNRSECPDSGLG